MPQILELFHHLVEDSADVWLVALPVVLLMAFPPHGMGSFFHVLSNVGKTSFVQMADCGMHMFQTMMDVTTMRTAAPRRVASTSLVMFRMLVVSSGMTVLKPMLEFLSIMFQLFEVTVKGFQKFFAAVAITLLESLYFPPTLFNFRLQQFHFLLLLPCMNLATSLQLTTNAFSTFVPSCSFELPPRLTSCVFKTFRVSYRSLIHSCLCFRLWLGGIFVPLIGLGCPHDDGRQQQSEYNGYRLRV